MTALRRRLPLRRALFLALVAILVAMLFIVAFRARALVRTSPVFDPPVLAGQMVSCTAGFYARRDTTIVLTISGHCYDRASPPQDAAGRPIGSYGAEARRADCPAGRTCAGSDIVELVLVPDRIPWGHLNLVDLGPGGYRTLAPGARPLACPDLHEGAAVETDGRGIYRSGRILSVAPYAFETDTIFPCMALTDLDAAVGDSGAPILIDGRPAGIAAREFGGKLGFTALAEGLADLGLELCTDPNCGLDPEAYR
ncbi:MAG: hypothetical protein E4H24_02455 [Thermomicrobiales bacterium]|jgi:hypothetical protein|nr:MAG: hypothetical protein E4H24_02455 [Thermomicrobiales bacterium]